MDSKGQERGYFEEPEYGCWCCGCMDFARDLADTGWVCVRCHPIEEYRAHVARCRAKYPSQRKMPNPDHY